MFGMICDNEEHLEAEYLQHRVHEICAAQNFQPHSVVYDHMLNVTVTRKIGTSVIVAMTGRVYYKPVMLDDWPEPRPWTPE
jgi:predicted metal-dependent TIM-barrel fold hydrolase